MKAWERLVGRSEARSNLVDGSMLDLFQFGNGLSGFAGLNATWGNEESLVRDNKAAYKSNGPVFALVQARLQVFSQIRFQWTRFSGGAPGDLFGTAELGLLENPWPGGTTADLLARMELDISRAGTAFIRRGNKRLHMLNPDWTYVVIGSEYDAETPAEAPDATLVGIGYKPPNGRRAIYLPNEVAIYAPIPDPDRLFCGMSWISPVLTETRADDLATVHKGKFFSNAATPNLAITFDPSVTKDQVNGWMAAAGFKPVQEFDGLNEGKWFVVYGRH